MKFKKGSIIEYTNDHEYGLITKADKMAYFILWDLDECVDDYPKDFIETSSTLVSEIFCEEFDAV